MEQLRTEVIRLFKQSAHVAHDEKHALRVAALAVYIAEHEHYDTREAEVAGLLHDMGRTVQKEEKDHGPAGVPLASKLLDTYTDFDEPTKKRILAAVHDHSQFKTEEQLTHIVQDADRLDGLGAIGIMRAYTSKAHLPDYNPDDIAPNKGKRDTFIHDQIAFQMEWLDMMYTETGRRLAQKRYNFMRDFLYTFEQEVNGEDFSEVVL